MINKLNVNNSVIFYTTDYDHKDLGNYYKFIVSKLKKILAEKEYNVKINFSGDFSGNIKSDINVWFQFEHTIIKRNNSLTATVAYFNTLNHMDYVFEYSNTNVEHLKNFQEYNNYLKKVIYLPPLNSETFNFYNQNTRNKPVVTMHNTSARRSKFFHMGYENIFDIYEYEKIISILKHFKILLNVHQIDEHLSLEELRITPLLFTGILVLSEKTFYIESLPHYKHIIWCDYDEIPDKINHILKNYEHYVSTYQKDIDITFKNMNNNIDNNIRNMLSNV